jgi:hypothetical protein
MQLLSVATVSLIWCLSPASAQTILRQQIWGTIIFTLYGDRTPYILPETYTLTPVGAQQLYSAGTTFRNRYINPTTDNSGYNISTAIRGLSQYVLDNDQVKIESTPDQFIEASAQAFMQGLYPPLQITTNETFVTGASTLADGTNVQAPLNGYQYPDIYTISRNDDNSIWISGEISCPEYSTSRSQYFSSPDYLSTKESTAAFYASLQEKLLDGIFSNASVGYFDAYYIWDYIQYGVTHNASIAETISNEDLVRARILADDLVFALNGNLSASGLTQGDEIRTIGGRTLATRIMEAIYTNIDTSGQLEKMTLLFSSFEPMVSFAALAGLANAQSPQFYGIPEFGSSMVFEIFSMSAHDNGGYPDRSDLNVRFLFQNGTGPDAALTSFPLFGWDPSEAVMSMTDFESAMQNIYIPSVANWCSTCKSYSVFCPAFVNGAGSSSPTGTNTGSDNYSSQGLKPAVAGVIGAVVALIVVGLVAALAMLVGGIRLYRSKAKRRSDLGGFKGAEKLASDQDLTIPKGQAGAVVNDAGSAPAPARGHERVGSWELGARAKAEETQLPNLESSDARRPSFEDDDLHVSPFAAPVKPDDRV